MNEAVIKHLEFIQAIISRMSANSFLVKGWAVTLVAALFALAAKDENASFAMIAYLPILLFWGLDAFYLSQERRYRALFNDVARGGHVTVSAFELDASRRGGATASWARSMLAATVVTFYGVLLVVTIVAMYFLWSATPK